MKAAQRARISLAAPNGSGTGSSIKLFVKDKTGRRSRFVITLSILATLYGSILAYRLLHYQADVFSDIAKMTGLIFITSAVLAYFWWTVIVLKFNTGISEGPKGGALAGFLTALSIIPLPTFVGAFKGAFIDTSDLIAALGTGLGYSISTFSLAEALALPLSAGVGFYVAKS